MSRQNDGSGATKWPRIGAICCPSTPNTGGSHYMRPTHAFLVSVTRATTSRRTLRAAIVGSLYCRVANCSVSDGWSTGRVCSTSCEKVIDAFDRLRPSPPFRQLSYFHATIHHMRTCDRLTKEASANKLQSPPWFEKNRLFNSGSLRQR